MKQKPKGSDVIRAGHYNRLKGLVKPVAARPRGQTYPPHTHKLVTRPLWDESYKGMIAVLQVCMAQGYYTAGTFAHLSNVINNILNESNFILRHLSK